MSYKFGVNIVYADRKNNIYYDKLEKELIINEGKTKKN